MFDVSLLATIRTAKESYTERYTAMDEAAVLHCVEMAKDGRMKNPAKIEAIAFVAHSRELIPDEDYAAFLASETS